MIDVHIVFDHGQHSKELLDTISHDGRAMFRKA